MHAIYHILSTDLSSLAYYIHTYIFIYIRVCMLYGSQKGDQGKARQAAMTSASDSYAMNASTVIQYLSSTAMLHHPYGGVFDGLSVRLSAMPQRKPTGATSSARRGNLYFMVSLCG